MSLVTLPQYYIFPHPCSEFELKRNPLGFESESTIDTALSNFEFQYVFKISYENENRYLPIRMGINLDFLSNFTSSIKCLEIRYVEGRGEIPQFVIEDEFSHLENFNVPTVSNNSLDCSVTDQLLLELLKICHSIQELDLSGCKNIKGDNWSLLKLTHLTKINLSRCHSFSDENLKNLLSNCPKIQDINVIECEQLSAAGLILQTENTIPMVSFSHYN